MSLRLQLILIVISILLDYFAFPFESPFIAAHLQVVVYVSQLKLV